MPSVASTASLIKELNLEEHPEGGQDIFIDLADPRLLDAAFKFYRLLYSDQQPGRESRFAVLRCVVQVLPKLSFSVDLDFAPQKETRSACSRRRFTTS